MGSRVVVTRQFNWVFNDIADSCLGQENDQLIVRRIYAYRVRVGFIYLHRQRSKTIDNVDNVKESNLPGESIIII
jgi:hypothetical protein